MALRIDPSLLRSLLVLGSVVEARDAYTGGHLWRVGTYARLLAEAAGLDKVQVFTAGLGGFLHDLGKIGVPDEILRKPARLTDGEYAVVKTHPRVGRELLQPHPLAFLALDAVASHHERFDGGGYPEGLAGEETPLMARIASIADAFDAMTSTRPYRRGMPTEQAVAILRAQRDHQFDGPLIDCFLGLAAAGKLDPVVGHSQLGRKMASCPHCGPIIAVPKRLDDGAVIPCRACAGALRLHRRGDSFEAEPLGPADPQRLAPQPDFDTVDEFTARLPA